jgi:hypothetical protein
MDGKLNEPKVICVLGMHRSGTSLLTRLLNLIGVDLGHAGSLTLEPVAANPKGYWENHELTSISDAILKFYGGAWDLPPVLPDGWLENGAITEFGKRVQQVVQTHFSQSSVWGWKDPRTCLLLPFWQQQFPSLKYIVCLRHPMSVAASLERRDGFTYEKSCSLWLTYVLSALEQTKGKSRLIVFYEDLMSDCVGQVERVREFIGNGEGALEAPLRQSIETFVDTSLYHHRSSSEVQSENSQAEIDAQSVYRVLRMGSVNALEYSPDKSDVINRLKLQVESQANALHEREQRITLLTEQLAESEQRIQRLKKPWTLLKK